MNTVDTATVNGWQIEIVYDEDGAANNPRDWCHGTDLALTHRRYDLPDDSGYAGNYDDLAELEAALREDHDALYVETVYGYDHSAFVLKARERTGQFADRWDSGIAGLAYVTRANWADTQGTEWTGSEDDIKRASELIKSDIDTYNSWANGEVYGYIITDPVDGETIDSCWGFVGESDYAMEEAKSVAESADHVTKCNGTLNRVTGEVDHAGDCPLHSPAPRPDKAGVYTEAS
jgi:hypothetical protein